MIIPCYTFPSMYPCQSDLMKLPPLAQNVHIGFHPRSAANKFPHLFLQFQKLAESPQVAAIGEIGLDCTRGISSYTIQKQYQLFRLSIQVAMSLNKLIVIHCRGGKNHIIYCSILFVILITPFMSTASQVGSLIT